jgi:hypothetical protein
LEPLGFGKGFERPLIRCWTPNPMCSSADRDSLRPVSRRLLPFDGAFEQGIRDICKFRGIIFERAVFDSP